MRNQIACWVAVSSLCFVAVGCGDADRMRRDDGPQMAPRHADNGPLTPIDETAGEIDGSIRQVGHTAEVGADEISDEAEAAKHEIKHDIRGFKASIKESEREIDGAGKEIVDGP